MNYGIVSESSTESRAAETRRRATGLQHRPLLAGPWLYVVTGDDQYDTDNSPPWEGTWDQAGAPYDYVAVRSAVDGLPEFKGVPTGGAFGTVAFTVPLKWRPDSPRTYYRDVLVGSVLVPSRWVLATNGEVTIYALTGGGAGEWCALGFEADYTVPLGGRHHPAWDVEANPHPDYFEIDNTAPGLRRSIRILQDGVYAATWGLYVDVFTPTYPTNSNIIVSLQHTTWTHEEEAVIFPPLGASGGAFLDLASPILTGSKVFLSGPDFDPVYMAITTDGTADSDLGLIGGDLNITYLKVIRLNSAEADLTDPNDYITGP